MWHVTYYMWLVTCDTWHMTGGGRWAISQKNISFLALTVSELRFDEYIVTKDELLTYSINDKGVCRTAPATQNLDFEKKWK